MRYCLGGKRGCLITFLAIAVLVAGGLGWVTADALRLERQQLEARAEAELSSKLRIGLWRLDSRMVTAFSNEANRPYNQYCVRDLPSPAASKARSATVVELALLPETEPPPWMGRHFLVASGREWKTPRTLSETMVRHLGISSQPPPGVQSGADRGQFLAELSSDQALQRLLTQVRQEDSQLAQARQQNTQTLSNNFVQVQENGEAGALNNDGQSLGNVQNSVVNPAQQRKNRDTELRYAVRAEGAKAPAQEQNSVWLGGSTRTNFGRKNVGQELAILGPLIPLWLRGDQEERLVVARLIQIGPKLVCHVTLLKWPEVQALLAEHIGDLFPQARFLPIQKEEEANPERAMTALPVELDPVSVEVPAPPSWSPVRIGLVLAWTAASLALLTVGLGGWSLLDLSERRIRFVSAVTHELRTPLTTLRLYLDMLTGGLVREEQQKAEYLQTLHSEAERLHQLVGNVLDFSRLEDQRPRLEKRTVRLHDLLQQLRSTWEDRCRSADKELVIDNRIDGDLSLHTDVRIVHQVLGNLIDNACKYSRGAADEHIWIRAYLDGCHRVVFEVEDRGPGVPPREGRSIFRPFRRGRTADVAAGGVGLGLALAQRWAQLLGGRLSLGNGPQHTGACFRLELPLEKGDANSA